ncbi:hypothetical protein [uncultured Planktosalinus sp.]|jgi:hypothetical protein|uniref:hypothetical protein n=1 Tax=uncultured Planktosalinus sp. TaxID=1810935 RepID=UPI0030DA6429
MKKKHFEYISVFLALLISFLLGRESKSVGYENRFHNENTYQNIPKFDPEGLQYVDTVHLLTGESPEVYVCNGKSSKRYHYKKNCRGLSNCRSSISKVSLEEAKRRGRTLCGWED